MDKPNTTTKNKAPKTQRMWSGKGEHKKMYVCVIVHTSNWNEKLEFVMEMVFEAIAVACVRNPRTCEQKTTTTTNETELAINTIRTNTTNELQRPFDNIAYYLEA